MARQQRLICASRDLVDGGDGTRFEMNDQQGRAPAFVIRHDGEVYAYLNRCGHVSVEMDWQPGRFRDMSGLYLICAVHGALYDPATGHCICGPCNGKGLTPLEVVEHDGEVFLMEG